MNEAEDLADVVDDLERLVDQQVGLPLLGILVLVLLLSRLVLEVGVEVAEGAFLIAFSFSLNPC